MICDKFPTSTVIIASLDVETMIECDRIMVMEAGRIVELHEPHALLQVSKTTSHYGTKPGRILRHQEFTFPRARE